ncbi:MAG: hypothetical protein GTO40_30010, partial [Deltaproteobacteria bacterium]|nr:hypothetical protein [Deltaproteobacteria bacterium]
IVQNIPGGKEIPSQLKIFNGRKDGSVLGVVNANAVEVPYLGTPGANYDPNKYAYIGSAGTGKFRQTLFTHVRAKFNTIEDLQSREVALGAHRVGHRVYMVCRLIGEVLSIDIRWVLGYSSPSRYLAVDRGEVDGGCNDAASAYTQRRDWFDDRVIVANVALTVPENLPPLDHPILAKTPSLLDYAKTDLHRNLILKVNTIPTIGYGFAFPPGTPEDIRKIGEKALQNIGKDPEFIKAWGIEVGIKPFPGMNTGKQVRQAVKFYTDWKPDVLEAYQRLGYKAP